MKLGLRYDMRRAAFSTATREELYRTSLEQCAWADARGFGVVTLAEHHAADDGYCPSTMVYGAAIAAVTKQLSVSLKAVLLPLHDPIRLAEDLAVLDVISGGRLELLFGAGYRPVEYAMFGLDIADRARLMEEKMGVLRQAWTGEPFDHNGTMVQVRPTPVRPGGPKVIFGGSTKWAARRAAQLADGYDPVPQAIATFEVYREECARLGKTPNEPRPPHLNAVFVMVAQDPEAVWKVVAPYALHESNSYGRWNADAGLVTGYAQADDAEALRQSGQYRVLTPAELVAQAKALGPTGSLTLHPLMGGLPVDLSWESLRLFEAQVMPALKAAGL